jgi:hypothetical protein
MQDGRGTLVKLNGGGLFDGAIFLAGNYSTFVDLPSPTGRAYRYERCPYCGGWHYKGQVTEVMKDAKLTS